MNAGIRRMLLDKINICSFSSVFSAFSRIFFLPFSIPYLSIEDK